MMVVQMIKTAISTYVPTSRTATLTTVGIKLLSENAGVPHSGTPWSAGYDLHAVEAADIPPHETRFVQTGIAMEIPEGFFGAIYARSGLATKRGLRPANCVGVVDSDYRGEVMVALHNDTDTTQSIEAGERIAQLIIQRHQVVSFVEVDELSDTSRGDGGFGSTGSK